MKRKVYKFILLAFVLILAVNLILGQMVFVARVAAVSADLPAVFEGYEIAQLSDIHSVRSAKQADRIVAQVEEISPDLIALTGDLVDSGYYSRTFGTEGEKQTLGLLARLTAIAPVYYIYGNHEMVLLDDPVHNPFRTQVEALGVTLLNNESETIRRGGESISIAGIQDPSTLYKDETYAALDGSAVKTRAMLDNVVNGLRTEDFVLLLAHRPEFFDLYVQSEADVILSGHAHGGQMRLPLVGGLYAPGQGIFPQYDAGLYEQDTTSMIVSRGIGNSMFPLRVFNPPEIVAVTLQTE
ncbi:MAG: metallophosphoesterase [Butyricicoccus sp.]|nr:metallophosphoesterase [Butyricicoccus sp.]MBQ8585042.1 metallophosphoesterase [Butyricicoccus sp.]